MELLRALAALAEPPTPDLATVAAELELGEPAPRAEYTELFAFQLPPYASIYLDDTGRLGGQARDRIAGLWRALGHSPPEEVDHLTVLLSTFAAWREAELGAAPDTQRGALRHRARVLLAEHLLSWLGPYLGRVRDIAPPFYRRWSELLATVLAKEGERLEVPRVASQHHRATSALARGDVDSEPERSVLTPVRSGLILTRSDLARAARDLGVAARIGARPFMLEAMFGQRPGAVRRWLAEEAHRVAGTYRTDPYLTSWEGVWAERAEATAAVFSPPG